MADAKLEQFRQQMREEEEKRNGNRPTSSRGDNASYPYWLIPENATSVVRFLPDKDDNNPWLFYVERQSIKLPFSGVVGGEYPSTQPATVTVPCVDMFEKNTCPIITETRPWWNDESKKDLARLYYKKRSYITQGFVVSSPFEESDTPENPIRRFIIGPELLKKLKAGMADPDMEYMPTDYMHGCDFRIRKTRKGEFNNYGTSEWARRTRPLSEAEQLALEQYGLFNLADFLGPRPSADEINGIREMFHASLAGEPFDMDVFGKYPWRPYGTGGGSALASVTTFSSSSSDDDVDDFTTTTVNTGTTFVRTEETSDDKTTAQPQDIMAKLRAKAATRA